MSARPEMGVQMERHGEGVYAVLEKEQNKDGISFYDDRGLLPKEDVRFDLDSMTVELSDRVDRGRSVRRRFVPYRRCFGRARQKDAPPLTLLQALGSAMEFNDFEDDVGNIPAGYTYFGQFIFHDLSRMGAGKSPDRPDNLRSAALDLDSIFGPLPSEHALGVACPAPMTLGETTNGRLRDIPRAVDGMPVIADQRNDSNLPLAQVHAAMIRFYNSVRRVCGDEKEAKRLTQLHIQSVVLHDYASRVIDEAAYRDVMERGRAVIHVDGGAFLLPLEFAAACARFGHTMIRNRYPWNAMNPGAHLNAFWDYTYNSAVVPMTRLPGAWTADWRRLLGIGGTHPILAARIGTRLAFPLKQMRRQVFTEGEQSLSRNLAVRSLERAHMLELSSAQHVFECVIRKLRAQRRPEIDLLNEQQLLDGESEGVCAALTEEPHDGLPLIVCTPLWFYILKESAVQNTGLKLGGLGGRIVMETLHAAIAAAEPSILTAGGNWRPDPRLRPSSSQSYTLSDLIAFSGLAEE